MGKIKIWFFTACFTAGLYTCLSARETTAPLTQTAAAVFTTKTVEAAAPAPVTQAAQDNITVTTVPPPVTPQAGIKADYAAAVKKAVKDSAVVKQALASLNEAKAILAKEQGVTGLNLTAGVFYSKSTDKSLALQMPEEENLLKYRAGLSSRLVTGGDISLNLTSSRMYMLFPGYSGSVDAQLFRPSINPYYYPGLTLSYSQPLLKGLLGLPEIKRSQAAAYRVKAMQEKLKQEILGIAYEIRKAWYEIYKADIYLKAAKNYNKDIENTYVSMKTSGRGEADLLLAKAALIVSQVYTRELEKNFSGAKEKYLGLAGFPAAEWETADTAPEETLEEVYIPQEMTEDLENTILSLQPAVTAEKFDALAVETESRAAEFAGFPRLDLTGSAGFNGISGSADGAFRSFGAGKYGDLKIGIDFSWDITGFMGAGEAEEKKQSLNRCLARFKEIENINRASIRQAYRGITMEKLNYEAVKEARLMLEKRVKLLQPGASAELIRAHLDRFNARKEEAAAFAAYGMAIADWNLVNGKYDGFYNQYILTNNQ